MAFIGNKILLGYEDEPVTDKYVGSVDFRTSKIGGCPNWMFDVPDGIKCRLCGLSSPLILQIYAPMSNSSYHRTLYIFACINPPCWNRSESWRCVRSQMMDSNETSLDGKTKASEPPSSWCSGSDAWGDDDSGCHLDYLAEFTQNVPNTSTDNFSDLNRGFSQMTVDEKPPLTNDSRKHVKAVPSAFAMIEGAEDNIVGVDSPSLPQYDVSALFQENSISPMLPKLEVEFSSFFIYVEEEDLTYVGLSEEDSIMSKLQEYRSCQENEADMMTTTGGGETYEKSLPPHGDKMFHRFLTRINANYGQVVRYGGYPLWLYSPEQSQFRCHYCGGQSAFEMQLLPTLIPKLFINGSTGYIEFGSVFIFSCLAGCWDPSQQQIRFENIVVQREII